MKTATFALIATALIATPVCTLLLSGSLLLTLGVAMTVVASTTIVLGNLRDAASDDE